ncbi:Rab-like protein 6 [Geodia barretti]|nr:Rab-like protein 6 [Geodia barretti]
MGNEHGKAGGGTATPAGIQSMDEALQKRFAKGIQFNMKIVLKGDRNTGKTCLFNRMGGKPFQEAYIPTMEIQVTSILWSYKVTSDTVKVEVWDVVDKGKVHKKEAKGGLKIFNTTPDEEEEEEGEGEGGKKVLDATFLNVYKGCNGVVLVFDMTKMWTWKYVERELPKVPFDIPVIVLGNFKDLGEHRVITRDEIRVFLRSVRPDGSSEILYAESSMKNAFGLMHLHKFLSVPFLQMQQDMLLQQIKVSREQMLAARDELSTASTTEDQNYDMFLARLQQAAEQRRKKAQQQREEESDLCL